jgi:hypothetical protein
VLGKEIARGEAGLSRSDHDRVDVFAPHSRSLPRARRL